jgi:C-terminal processing protease CtpA/Prc
MILLGLLSLLAIAPLLAQAPTPVKTSSIERLTHLAKLWGTVRYLHPWLAYKEIDWDAALVQAIPKVRGASTAEQYAAAVQGMLDALGDPVTRVQAVPHGGPEAEDHTGPIAQWLEPGVLSLYLRPNSARTFDELTGKLAPARAEIPKAKAVIVDVRGMAGERFYPKYLLAAIEGLLVSRPATAPVQRYLVHSGYRTQLPGGSGSYSTGFMSLLPDSFTGGDGPAPQRVVFLVNADTAIPPLAAALQASGQGAIVAEGKISEEGLVQQRTVALGEGFEALVRTTEIEPAPGWPGVHADVEAAPSEGEAAALRLARDGWPAPRPSSPRPSSPVMPSPGEEGDQQGRSNPAPLPQPAWHPDKRYEEMTDPSLEYRLLAVFRIWNVFHYFYPYLHLIGDWDAVLPEFIARMEEVKDGREYALAIAEMATHTGDGHTSVTGNPTLDRFYGETSAPVAIRWIEGAWVVTTLADDQAPGLEVGDVVLTVDGEPVAVREGLLRRYLAASTEAGLRRKIADRLLSGPKGSTVSLTVRGRDDRVKKVDLKRQPWTPKLAGETVRLLPGNLGYVDLNRLTVEEIDGMFERLKETRGIVFDMRGYPQGTGWFIAPRLNVRGARYGALFSRRLVSAETPEREQTSVSFSQPIETTDSWIYKGKTVLLIDERTVSQSEHLGLFFEAAAGTKFVGTPTAGANGDITFFSVPGIASFRFGGHEVRHADGRQLQRIGLVPDVLVAPTLRGIRAGKDEVLERGIEVLTRELAAQGAAGSPAERAGGSGTGGGTSSY